MPIATPKQFAIMLDAAQEGSYAYPAINCTSIVTLNAALKAFADNKSDGIIQFSTGAGQFASGLNNKDATKGTIILAEAAHALAEQYDVLIGLNTDHCQPGTAESFLDPLIEATALKSSSLNGAWSGSSPREAGCRPCRRTGSRCSTAAPWPRSPVANWNGWRTWTTGPGKWSRRNCPGDRRQADGRC